MSRASSRVPRTRQAVAQVAAAIAGTRDMPIDEQVSILAEIVRLAQSALVRIALGVPRG